MAFLAPFALLTTRYGLPLGEARTRHREELQALVAEAAAVGRACGAPADPAQAMARYDAFPPGAKSSMQRDAEAGRPLELDAIGGALLRAAARHAVAAPVTARLVGELRAMRPLTAEGDGDGTGGRGVLAAGPPVRLNLPRTSRTNSLP